MDGLFRYGRGNLPNCAAVHARTLHGFLLSCGDVCILPVPRLAGKTCHATGRYDQSHEQLFMSVNQWITWRLRYPCSTCAPLAPPPLARRRQERLSAPRLDKQRNEEEEKQDSHFAITSVSQSEDSGSSRKPLSHRRIVSKLAFPS